MERRTDAIPFPVSVNVSAHQFRYAGLRRTRRADAAPRPGSIRRGLELEVTESVLLHEWIAPRRSLRELRLLGVSIALDDFGTGYSSLSYLSRLPVDRIKIDRSFIQRIVHDERTGSIVRGSSASGATSG